MYPNQYQNQYQYPNQFGGFQNHIIEPPMPTNMPKNGSNFWVGFIGGIITAIIIFVGIEFLKRIRNAQNPAKQPLPNPNNGKSIEVSNVQTIAEEIPSIFEISKPIEKQTFDEFLTFLQTQGFEIDDDASDVTGKEVWRDDNNNEIHFGSLDFTVKSPNANAITFSKKEALFVKFNENLLNYFANENPD